METHLMNQGELQKIINGEEEGIISAEPDSKDDDAFDDTKNDAGPDYEEIAEGLKQRVERQDTLLAKMGTELGMLRKTSPEEEREKLQELRDLSVEDPIAFQEKYEEYKNEKRSEEERKFVDWTAQNKATVENMVPDFNESISDIVEILEADKISSENIAIFKNDPFKTPGELLFMLHKRAAVVKENKALSSKVFDLEAKISELEKKPGDILSKIEAATGKQPLTNKSGGVTKQPNKLYPTATHRMSREDLVKIVEGE